MTKVDLKTAWTEVEARIDVCRQQLRLCERAFVFSPQFEEHDYERSVFEEEKELLGFRVGQAHLTMLILFELLALPLFKRTYESGFSQFKENLTKVEHHHDDPEIIFSPSLTYLSKNFDAVSSMFKDAVDLTEVRMNLLESILRNTPYILSDRNIIPKSESDIRNSLLDFLKIVFPECRRDLPVSHIFKTYKADLGISSLKTLVEVKYALDERELKSELDGIYADMKGYTGDPAWNRFIALFYTAKPIASPERLLEEFKLSRADMSWTPIIVHGPGERTKKKAIVVPKAKLSPKANDTSK